MYRDRFYALLFCFSVASLNASNPASWVAYVTDSEMPGIFSIDAATKTATETVRNDTDVHFITPLGVAISPDGTYAYVTDFEAATIYYVDTCTNVATKTVTNLTETPFLLPAGVAISPNGKFAYMADFNGTVYYIDTATNRATKTVTNSYSTSPTGFENPPVIAISSNNEFAYVTDSYVPAVYRIDTKTNAVTAQVSGISVGYAEGLAISPNNRFVYVASGYHAPVAVYRIDTSTNVAEATTTSTAFSDPNGVAISPDGSTAFISDPGNHTVFYIDTKTNTVTKTVSVPNEYIWFTNSLTVTPDGKTLYVAGGDSLAIYSIDIASGTVSSIANESGSAYAYPSTPGVGIIQIPTNGLTYNNLRLANYLNANASRSVISLFAPLQGDALSAALESAAPTRNAFLTFTSQITQIAMGRLLYDQLRQDRWRNQPYKGSSVAAAPASDSLVASLGDCVTVGKPRSNTNGNKKPYSVWSGAFGEYAHEKKQHQSPAFSTGSGGLVAAWDYKGKYAHPVGVGFAYAHTHLHEEEGAGHANIDQGDLFCYGTFTAGQWYFDTAFWGGYYHAKNVRKIHFKGFANSATMKTDGWQFTPHLEVGYEQQLGWFGIEPFAQCDWVNCWEKGANESGAGILNMGQNGRYCSLLRSETGVHFEEILTYGWGTLTLMEKGSYAYQKTFHTGNIRAFLIGSPGSFEVSTLTGAQNLGVGEVEALFTPNSKRYPYGSLSYHVELGSRYQTHQGMIKIGGDF